MHSHSTPVIRPSFFEPDLEPDVGLRPAAMGDEGLLAVDHQPHAALGLAREQRRDQLDIERLGAAAEAAADMRLDHADLRHVHGEDLRQHQVDVVGHLRGGMHRHAVAHGVVARDRGMHLHLVLADLGAVVGRPRAPDRRRRTPARHCRARRTRRVRDCRASWRAAARRPARARRLRREIGRQLLHLHLDAARAPPWRWRRRRRRRRRPARRDSAPCRAPADARCARSAARRRSCRNRRR